MANPSIQLGTNSNWAVKEDKLLAYKEYNDYFFNKEFDFSRGTSATYVAKDSLIKTAGIQPNIVKNGDFATDSDWNLSNAAIEDGVAKIQDSQGGFSRIRQNTGFTGQAKVTYTISFNNSSNTTIQLRSYGGLMVNNALPATVGTHTVYEDFASDAISFQTGLAAGEEIHLDNVSVQEIQTDTPRIDFTNDTKGHLLLEPQSTNKVTQSETFSTWPTTNALKTSVNLTAPDGSNSVIKLSSSTTSGGEHKVRTNTDTTSATDSIFAKMGEVRYIYNRRSTTQTGYKSVVFDLQEGVVERNNYSTNAYPKITYYGNGWYRCEVYYENLSANGTGWGLSDGNGHTYNAPNTTDGLYIWGVQQEDLSYATSYIPTQSSTSTRNADVCNNSGSAQDFNSEEGVLYAEIAYLSDTGTYRTISINDGTNNNMVAFENRPVSNQIKAFINVSGVSVMSSTQSLTNVKQFNKIAIKWKQDDFAWWVNGVQIHEDLSGSTFASGVLNKLNFNNGIENFPFEGKVRNVQVFTEALTDSELQELTS